MKGGKTGRKRETTKKRHKIVIGAVKGEIERRLSDEVSSINFWDVYCTVGDKLGLSPYTVRDVVNGGRGI
ncbi:hypothetical protein JW935_15865 [candidate division KSB1 bacterium]|nr:hypothetical protein [candidate division KSB1 bacterium]